MSRRLLAVVFLAGALLLEPPGTLGHPMGNFSISHYSALRLSPEGLELRYLIDMAEVPTFQEMQETGLTAGEWQPEHSVYLARQVEALRQGLMVELNGRPLSLRADLPEMRFTPGAGDLPTLKMGVVFRASLDPMSRRAVNRLQYQDGNFPDRIGWKEIVATVAPGLTLVQSSVPEEDRSRALGDYPSDLLQSPPQDLEAEVLFAWTPAVAAAGIGAASASSRPESSGGLAGKSADQPSRGEAGSLTHPRPGSEMVASGNGAQQARRSTAPRSSPARVDGASRAPADRPESPAAEAVAPPGRGVADGGPPVEAEPPGASPVSVAIANAVAPGPASASPREPNRAVARGNAFAALVTTRELSSSVVLFAALVAASLGAFHALEPGHGKTMVAAYLIGSRGTAWHALLLGLIVTASHTTGVYLLGAVTLYASRFIVPERLYPWLAASSGLVIAGLGFMLFLKRYAHDHAHDHEQDHGHGQAPADRHAHEAGHLHPHAHAPAHEHHDGCHDHAHSHAHGRWGRPHRHPAPGTSVSWKELLALGVSGGIVPCPAALVVLLSAVALRRVGFGLFLIVAFSVGLAAVLVAIGLLMVHARRLMSRVRGDGPLITRWLPLVSSAVITLLGLVIAVQALVAAQIVQIRL
jgi:ABC-type nickel/cobalt efflux system permease component RcnA